MSDRAVELERRRLELQAVCAQQRLALNEVSNAIEDKLYGVDRALTVARSYTNAPILVGAAITLFAFAGRARFMRWIGPIFLVASTIRRLSR